MLSILQILEDGIVTDSQGRTVNFKNTIIIMTSNLGSDLILEHGGDPSGLREQMTRELRSHFRPEFLNRIDEVLIFHKLERDQLVKIVDIQLARLAARLRDQEIAIDVTPEAKELVCESGYDPAFGARPLKRAVIQMLETPLSRKLIAGEILPGETIRVGAKDGQLVFEHAK